MNNPIIEALACGNIFFNLFSNSKMGYDGPLFLGHPAHSTILIVSINSSKIEFVVPFLLVPPTQSESEW